jgi:hypothetical protein
MSLLELSIWLILLVIFGIINLRIAFGDIRDAKRGESFSVLGFLWNFLAGLLCIYASYVAVDTIADYQRAPKVCTSQTPKVDTLEVNGQTKYLYEFQDNEWPGIRDEIINQ